jgi:hypothetical protein
MVELVAGAGELVIQALLSREPLLDKIYQIWVKDVDT